MDVLEQRKLDRAVRNLRSLGVSTWTAAPPLHRLLWRLGVPLPPPHFMTVRQTALTFGAICVFAAIPLMILFEGAGFSRSGTLSGTVLRLGATLTAVGLLMGGRFRAQARTMHLPSWSDYVPEGGDSAARPDQAR